MGLPSRRRSAADRWAYRGTGCRSLWSLTTSRGESRCIAYKVPDEVRTAKLPVVASVSDSRFLSISIVALSLIPQSGHG
ncbi:hypothetical protein BJQ90_02041 [Arthrobacter sp. SO3]|nr:hypothetical protein [Arthrobacter sp. SO3]